MIGTFEGSQRGFQAQKVIVWTGAITDIPAGWFVCDGNNGTPNLTNKMLRGHGSANTSAGATGGANQKTISESQMASHTHSVTVDSTVLGSHNHGITRGSNNWEQLDTSTGSNDSFKYNSETFETQTNGQHAHSFSVGNTGTESSIENRPGHKNVIYIMRK